MLSPVPTSLVPLALTVAPEDAPQVCARRKQKPPRSGTAQSAAPTSTSGTSGTSASKSTKSTKSTKVTGSGSASRTTAARASASGYARTASPSKSSSSAKKPGPLAFLDDPKLSMEEKLLKLLAYLNDKWNKELDQKMKEFKQTSTSTTTSSSGGSSGVGGLVKKAVGFASSAVPQLGVTLAALRDPTVRTVLKNVAGPALAAVATAAGQPQLAPVALRYGPDLVDAAAGAASYASSSTAGSSSASSGGSSRTTTKETADGIGSDRDAQLKLMEMQRILDQQKEMFSLVSNLLRTTHDTRMAVIQNVR
jgi:hypothetical protein